MGLTLLFVLPNSTLFSLEGFEIYIKSKETIEKFTWFVYFCMFGWLVVSLQVLILTFHHIFAFFLNFPVLLSRSWSEIDVTWVSAVKQQISLSLIQSGTKTKRTQIIRAYSSAYDFEVERWRKKNESFFLMINFNQWKKKSPNYFDDSCNNKKPSVKSHNHEIFCRLSCEIR